MGVPVEFDFDNAWRVAERFGSYALLVMQEGVIRFERYANGWSAERPAPLASGSKSFVGPLAIAAVQDGLFRSLDERVADTIPEWKEESRKSKITLRQLLTLTSGLSGGRLGNWISYEEALRRPVRWEPGTRFAYGPVPFLAFGGVLKQKLKKESVEEYMNRRLLKLLGVRVFWQKTRGGSQEIALPGGARATARDWATYGQWLLQQGQWKGQTILPAAALKECFKGTPVNPAYGLTFWLTPDPSVLRSTRNTKSHFAMAAGAGGQRLYLLFDIGTVVVRLGPVRRRDFRDLPLLKALLPRKF